MREFHHGIRLGRVAVAMVTLGISLGATGPVAGVDPSGLDTVRRCPTRGPDAGRAVGGLPRTHMRGRVDGDGVLRGYDLHLGAERALRLDRGGFVDGPFGGVVVVGERRGSRTRLVLLELRRRCSIARTEVAGLVYGSHLDPASGAFLVSLVEPGSRRELGIWRLDPTEAAGPSLAVAPPRGSFATATHRSVAIAWDGGPVGRWCVAGRCEERRTDPWRTALLVDPDSGNEGGSPPVVTSRPVPEEPAPRWPRDARLSYRWHGTETPPSWIRGAINAAALDVGRSRRSRTPTFEQDGAATDSIRYTASFPAASCATSIACASYDIGSSWTVRLRPHGTDFRWGTLRWCQADDRDGCFDVERVMLHEFGHIVGIDHPESAGFSLRPFDTVMGQLAPSKPRPGSSLHAFGDCDVATLQERYDVPSPTTPISRCNDVDTTLALSASATSVPRGARVTLVADLRIPDRDAYDRLGGNPISERSVQLRRRPLGSTSAWTVFQMRAGDSAGTYLLTIAPSISYEFQAVFAAPGSEGLRGSTSPVVNLRVVDGCGVSTCPNTEDPME